MPQILIGIGQRDEIWLHLSSPVVGWFTTLNLRRVAAWLAERPRAQTRVSAFARIASAA